MCRLLESLGPCRRTYVDLGAHHPIRFSNTAALRRRNWVGVNVDGDNNNVKYLKSFFRKDVALSRVISVGGGSINFYRYADSAYNTSSLSQMQYLKLQGIHPIITMTTNSTAVMDFF